VAASPLVHEVLRASGQPLDTATRTFFEPRFGFDFSQVRVHHDRDAAESARALGAHAAANIGQAGKRLAGPIRDVDGDNHHERQQQRA
jgi:hypothetical protein